MDHVYEVAGIPVPSGPPFGQLDFRVDPLQDAVGDARLHEVNDSRPVSFDGSGEGLKSWDFGFFNLFAPPFEKCFSLGPGLHAPEVFKEGFETISLAQPGIERDEVREGLALLVGEPIGVPEEEVLMAFESLMFLTFSPTHLIHGFVEQFDDMKAVKGNLGLWEGFASSCDEGGGHVHAQFRDLRRLNPFASQVLLNLVEGFFAFARNHVDDAGLLEVNAQRDILMSFLGRGLVHAQVGQGHGGISSAGLGNPVVEDRPDPLGIDLENLGHAVDGHFPLDQSHCHGFKQEREATSRPGPRDLNCHHFTVRGLDARHGTMQQTRVFEEVQVLPLALDGVMDGAGRAAFVRKAGASGEADMQMKDFLAFLLTKNDVFDFPGFLQAQSHAK